MLIAHIHRLVEEEGVTDPIVVVTRGAMKRLTLYFDDGARGRPAWPSCHSHSAEVKPVVGSRRLWRS
ncbi:MAG: hypothetical protein USCGTAYLOR_02334 [Chromatiales bacterium USCg_Taylor]|nr:MAG: hypothetical protein USCGTAYLOR_02334 [Chromatiales bacterium USCg_Taylor]